MLTSFFGKSSPLNFLLVGAYILILSTVNYLLYHEGPGLLENLLTFVGILGVLIFSMLLFDFIVRKNALTQINTYDILLFSCILVMLPALNGALRIVLANFFILLALRRIVSFQSFKNNERKILDASLWIAVASIFYFWSILMLIVLYLALLFKPQKQLRYYLIPLITWGGIFLIATAYHYLVDDSFGWFLNWLGDVSFQFSNYGETKIWIFISFVMAMIIWTVVSKILSMGSISKKDKPNQILILYALAIGIGMALISPQKNGAEFLFFVAPASVMITSYIEKKQEMAFREIILWVFLLLPLAFLFF